MAGEITSVQSPSSTLQLQDFMKLLLTQLTAQDPLSPQNPQDFIVQIAQMTNLQQNQRTADNTTQMLSAGSASQAVTLLGKTVEVVESGSSVSSGTVSGVRFSGGSPVLSVKLASGTVSEFSLSQVVSVR